MNFLVDINPNMKPIEYKMVLCKLNEEQIMTITNISNLEYKGEFVNIDELSFEIPLYRMESDGTQIKNERYDAIKGDMLILLNGMKYFYIHYAKEKVNSDGSTYKEVQAYSREFELSNKIISGYSGVSRKIYDYTNQKDENNLEYGYFNYIEHICSWRVSYVNPNVLAKFRALDFPNTNVLQSFQEVQQTFGCLLQFNTLDKTIDIYEADQLGINQGLRITDRNFLQTLEKTIKSDAIKTRLHLFGRDNISIQKLSITGQDYIDNYDFYKTTEYMSQDLIDALNNYDAYLLTKQGLFNGYLTQLNAKKTELGTRNDELVGLQTQLKVIQSNLDIAISSGQPTGTFKTQETTKLADISAKLSQILTLQNEIEVIEGNINSIAVDTDMTAHFTEAQARELDSFIREETFTDSNYTEDNLDELLAEGKKILSRISQPAIQFNVSVVDFLSVVECQHEWSKFVLGDKVNLFHRDLNFDYEVRLVGYTHNPDSNSLDLKFSNTNTIDDANLYLRDLLADLKTTSTNVDFSRFKWDKGEQANSMISNYINSNLDLEKQKIMGVSNQKPLVDERGIWLVKDVGGVVDNEQTRLVNNAIVMTKDNWNTSDIAISPNSGINASLINGKIGNLATLNAEQINVGGGDNPPNLNDELTRIQQETQDKINLVNGEISDVDGKINGLENFTNTAFKDGILDMAEKESLLVHIQQLNNEKSDVDAKYTSIYADVNLIGTPKSSLLTTKNNYNTSHSTLLTTINNITGDDKITEAEKTLINNAFIDYRAKLSALSTAFENAIRAIESKKAEIIANDLIVNFNTNTLVPAILGVQTQIDGKIESWNQEDDPSTAWNTANLKLKHTGDMWYKLSTKELKRYSGSAWVLIEDKQAIDAYALANTKRTIFTAQPTTPYVIGDLWKVSNIAGIDFKICMTSRSSGVYVAGDWVNVNDSKTYIDTQRTELNTSIAGLNTTISTAFSDSSITNIEAQSISLARDSVIKEANDIRAIAVSLSVSITSLDSAISSLNTEVNKYVGKTTYPITVTATNRTALADAFTGLEGAITQLYKNIDEKRLANTSSSLAGIIDGIQTDLQTQIDGKIDTWFYAVEPTLSNPPVNSWTTNDIKDKHIDDLYYDTVKGFAYRFTKVGTVYSWQRIMDSDITKALNDASTAKATADGKMTVYIAQPTTPYHKGDLWRETANATDLKICTTERLTGDYVAGDWSNATNVSGALSGLGNQIGDFSSDLKLTLAEANSLKMSLESATSESTELIATATALSIAAEKTNYSTALATLTNYLNTNWLGKTYPLTITIAQRTTVTNYFKDLEDKKSILLTKITEVRATKTYNDAKDYTDNNALKQNFYYNRTKITEAEGVEVFDGSNIKRIQIGAIDTDGNGTKDNYGIMAIHSNNSKTILDTEGFKRQIVSSGNVYNYINLSYAGDVITTGAYNGGGSGAAIVRKTTEELDALNVGINWIAIPNLDFKNRNFVVIPSLLSFITMGTGMGGGDYYSDYLDTDIKILKYDYANGRFKIRARKCWWFSYRGEIQSEKWSGLAVSYYAYALS